ncbi:MAG: efflux transporter outer membrane subunit [Lentisphaeria bacterium]|nr:efflux transporter outer membrane subunit [Lentisphaeria bacterium]
MRRFYPLSLCMAGLILTACVSSPWHLRPTEREKTDLSGVPETFSSGGGDREVTRRWWEHFQSPELNRLVDSALVGNLDLATARARLAQAEATAGVSRSGRYPSLSGEAGATNTERHVKTLAGDWDRDNSNRFQLGLTASFEVDLWGRLNAIERGALSQVTASAEDVSTAELMVTSEIVTTWIDIRTTQVRLAILNRQLETNQQTLDLLQLRRRRGMANAVDVLQQQQQTASTASAIPQTAETLALLKHRLAVLLGLPPSRCPDLADEPLPELPPLPATGLPADLLTNRPDLRAAWARLTAQDWAVVSARAERLPALRLTGSATADSARVEDLLDNWAASLAAALVQPLIDGGKRRAEVRRARAAAAEAVAEYRQTTLAALRDVENALASDRFKRDYVAKVTAEDTFARQTLEETTRRYQKGLSSYLPVLTALNTRQRSELAIIQATGDRLIQRVNLYKALGGQVPPES